MVLGMVLVAAEPARAVTKTVKVYIDVVWQIDPVDSSDQADFYWYVTLNSVRLKSAAEPYRANDNKIEPGQLLSFSVPSGSSYPLTIELWDDDGSGDDICDISKTAGATGSGAICTLVYNPDSNTWTGDTSTGYTDGEAYPDSSTIGDENDCALWFHITSTG